MKIPLFSRITARPRARKVVRASAARAVRDVGDDYYEEAEPNMKLSHAFMVVLVLHIVAVGGIYAFNQIHSKKSAGLAPALAGKPAAVAESAAVKPAPPQRLPGDADEPLPAMGGSVAASKAAPSAPIVAVAPAVAMTATKSAAPKVESKPPAPAKAVTAKEAGAKPAAGKAEAEAPGTYKVAKGDNPYTIAKKLGISATELLALNGIDDPKKLQIGQILKVPAKAN